jgi:hypothetical protein
MAQGTADFPGDVKAFDVIASFPKIAAYAGEGAQLIKMEARYVPTNGLMDLTKEYKPLVDLEFAAKATQKDVDVQGPQAPGSGFVVGDLIDVSIELRAPYTAHVNIVNQGQYFEKHLGMDRETGNKASANNQYVTAPKCSFAQLWRDAIAKGSPSNVESIITYNAYGYEFKANGTNFSANFDIDCKLTKSYP